MPKKNSPSKDSDAPLRFRPLDAADDLRLIVERETEGNVSKAIRISIQEKAERLRSMDLAA